MNSQNKINHLFMAFRKFLHENARRLLYYAALMFATMLLSYLIFAIIPILSRPQSNLNYTTEIMQITIFLLFVFGCLSASIMFRELRNRRTRIAYICFPTTKFEKYIIEWFVYVLLFPFIFLLLSELSVKLLVAILHFSVESTKSIENISVTKKLIEFAKGENSVFLFFLTVQSCFMIGSTYWRKFPFIKTFLCIVGISISLFFYALQAKNQDILIAYNYVYVIFTLIAWALSYIIFRRKATLI